MKRKLLSFFAVLILLIMPIVLNEYVHAYTIESGGYGSDEEVEAAEKEKQEIEDRIREMQENEAREQDAIRQLQRINEENDVIKEAIIADNKKSDEYNSGDHSDDYYDDENENDDQRDDDEPTNTSGTKCTYSARNKVRKDAQNVKVVYEIKTDDSGVNYVEINIYNITPRLYVMYYSDIVYATGIDKNSNIYNAKKTVVSYFDLNGEDVYTIKDYDIYFVKRYTFNIGDASGVCGSGLKTLTITKPKYNDYADMDECKEFDSQDYMYCKKWITKTFTDSPYSILERIKKQRDQVNKLRSTECLSCSEIDKDNAEYQKILMKKKIIIIGLIIGIVVDIIVILILIKRVKESRFV